MVDTQANVAAFQPTGCGYMDNGFTAGMITDGSAVNDRYEIIPACPIPERHRFQRSRSTTIPMQSKNKDEAFKYLGLPADAATQRKSAGSAIIHTSFNLITGYDSELANPAADDIAARRFRDLLK